MRIKLRKALSRLVLPPFCLCPESGLTAALTEKGHDNKTGADDAPCFKKIFHKNSVFFITMFPERRI